MKVVATLKSFAVVLAISVGILIFAEGLMRILYPEKVENARLLDALAYEFNEDYLVSLKPNTAKQFERKEENGGYVIRWRTNSDSFRGAELRPDPGRRVMVYGDSNIQARFSGDARTFPAQLESYLKASGVADVEVINAGVVGSGPDQGLIRFARDADSYRPDLVIFHVFADNDFGDIVRNRLFNLSPEGGLVASDHARAEDKYLKVAERNKRKTFISQLLIVRAITEYVAALQNGGQGSRNPGAIEAAVALPAQKGGNGFLDLLLRMNEEEYLVYTESRPRKFSVFSDHYDIDIALDPERESSRTKIRLMEAVLKEANQLAKGKGIRFLVLIQPSVVDLTEDNFVLGYGDFREFPTYRRRNLTDAVERVCASNDIPAVNLYELFLANDPEDLFFRADDHWTDRGQQLAARETAKFIVENGLIEQE